MFLRKTWARKTAARIAVLGLVVGLTSLGRPSEAHGQERFSIEGRGGIAVPASDLANLQDVGPSFGVGLMYPLNPRVSLRLDGDVDILSGVDADGSGPEAPDLNIYHYTAGLEVTPGGDRPARAQRGRGFRAAALVPDRGQLP